MFIGTKRLNGTVPTRLIVKIMTVVHEMTVEMSRLVADAIFHTCTLDHNPTKYAMQLSLMSCDQLRCRFVAGMISILYPNTNDAHQSQQHNINLNGPRFRNYIIFHHGRAY